MGDGIVHFAAERAADLIGTVNASTADWPHCRPIDAELLAYWRTRAEYQPRNVLMQDADGKCVGVLHGELVDGTAHVHLLALRPGEGGAEAGHALMREWERLAREARAGRIVSGTWRASLLYGGYILGNEPYHPHWAKAATDAYLRAGFRISHPALILVCDLQRRVEMAERPPEGYEIVEVTPGAEYGAQTFGFHAMYGDKKAAHCYARLYPKLCSMHDGKSTGQIGNVTTEPEHRNRGLARIMVAMSLRRLAEMGGGEALIATGLDNEPALRAYERCGFERRHFIMEWSKVLKQLTMLIASPQLLDTALPVLAGTSFATVGITYQMAQNRKVTPLRIFLLLAICGCALFTVKCLMADAVDLSSRALLLGIVAGLSQYLSIKLVGRAMALGPFSLVWCVLSLAFAPVALYAAAVQGSPQHWTLWLAVGAAALCCILAAAGHGDASSTAPATIRAKLAYGFLLVVILFVNAISQISIQDLNVTAAGRPRDSFFLCLYVGIAVASLIDAIGAEELASTIRRAWFPGLLAGIGSVCGMLSLGAGSARTGASAFLICSMVTLILPMLAAVLFFHERVSLRWIGTLILGLSAIGLANFRLLRELL